MFTFTRPKAKVVEEDLTTTWTEKLPTRRNDALEDFPQEICREHHGCVSLFAHPAFCRRSFGSDSQDYRAHGRGNWHGAAGISRAFCRASRLVRLRRIVGRKELTHSEYQWISAAGRRVLERTRHPGSALARRMLRGRLSLA